MAAFSNDPGEALVDAVRVLLSGLDTVSAAKVFTQSPLAGVKYPYTIVWRATAFPVDEDCFDRTETILRVEIHADTVSFMEARRIAGAYRAALHEQTFDIAGHRVDRCRVETIEYGHDLPRYPTMMMVSVETQPV